jgi:dTDP-4-dehydrorhamnose 3,5-epimerase
MVSEIGGVAFHELESRSDHRGALTELYRNEWGLEFEAVQWNVVSSIAGVLRGVHCHVRHDDLLSVAHGELILGLVDARPESPTYRRTELHRVLALSAVVRVPVGVGHGFYFEEPTTMVYAVSDYWDVSDELGCRWDAPDLGIGWPATAVEPVLSRRDQEAGSFAEMAAEISAGRGAVLS